PGEHPVSRRCVVNIDSVESVSVAVLVERLGWLASYRLRQLCGDPVGGDVRGRGRQRPARATGHHHGRHCVRAVAGLDGRGAPGPATRLVDVGAGLGRDTTVLTQASTPTGL